MLHDVIEIIQYLCGYISISLYLVRVETYDLRLCKTLKDIGRISYKTPRVERGKCNGRWESDEWPAGYHFLSVYPH